MKHRKSLLLSIWGIAIGIILSIIGYIVSRTGIVYHPAQFLVSAEWWEYTTVYYLGFAVMWLGIAIVILAVFGIGTTFIREYLDREHKTTQPPPPPQPS
jgi:hypothetical protein